MDLYKTTETDYHNNVH